MIKFEDLKIGQKVWYVRDPYIEQIIFVEIAGFRNLRRLDGSLQMSSKLNWLSFSNGQKTGGSNYEPREERLFLTKEDAEQYMKDVQDKFIKGDLESIKDVEDLLQYGLYCFGDDMELEKKVFKQKAKELLDVNI